MKVFEILKTESKADNLCRFSNEYKEKSFYDTYVSLFNTANIVKYLNNLVSITFCYCFFSLAFQELNPYLSIILSILCTGVIEVIKTKVINVSSVSYFKRGYTAFTVTAVVSVGFLALSVYTSLIGSERFNNLTNKTVSNVEQSNTNKRAELLKNYTDRIEKANQEKRSFFTANSVKYQGKIQVDYRAKKTYNKLQNEVLRLEKLKDEALNNFDNTATTKIHEAEQGKTNVSMYFMCISIINELLLLACIWFSKYFSFVAYKENENISTAENKPVQDHEEKEVYSMPKKGEQVSDLYQSISKKIGFDISEKIDIKSLNYLSRYPSIVNALLDGKTPYRVYKDKIGKQTTVYKVHDILKAIKSEYAK